MMRVVTVAAHKGGVGKTVTAMALASAYARTGAPTLLVDLDPQGHSTLGLGVDLDDRALTVRDAFIDPPVESARAIVGCMVPQLSVLPATIALERVTQWLYMRPRRETVLETALRPLRSVFRWVVVDCPPSLGALTEAGVHAADLVVVPCRMEARASDGLVDLLELVTLIKGEGFDAWRILQTQIDRRKSTTNAAVEAALAPWASHRLEATIPQSEPLNQAQIARVDVFSFDPKCSGAIAYQALSVEIGDLPVWQKRIASSI